MVNIRRMTGGRTHHFFGYYDKCPWDASGRYLLALETAFMDRRPGPDDVATVGVVHLQAKCIYMPQATTRAWNWQQGCQLHWLNAREIIYNDRLEDAFVSVILNLHTGARRVLPRPIYALSPDKQSAIVLNFSRAYDIRAGYGYAGIPDPWREVGAPEDDGIYWMNLTTGENRLIISTAQIAADVTDGREEGVKHWLDHLQFNTDGSRFVFLHRWGNPRAGRGAWWQTRLFTAAPDGTEIYCLSDHDMVSHFDWRDPDHILAWARRREVGDRYFLFTDRSDVVEVVGEGVLTVDGHCSYSPDRKWLLTDTYPDKEGRRTLLLWDLERQRRVDIDRFYGPTPADVEIRCDLHPRWSHDGRQICIDSIHEGTRQMYVLDVPDHQ